MRSTFTKLTETVYAGIFPKADVAKGLEYIGKAMPHGNKQVLTVDSMDTARMNGYAELVTGIQFDSKTERLLIVEIL